MTQGNPPIVPSGFSIYDGRNGDVLVVLNGVLQDDSPSQIVLPLIFSNRNKAKEFLQEIMDEL